MSFAEAFAPIEAHYRAQVIAATFGHLAPEPLRVYSGEVLFTRAQYGQASVVIIDSTIGVDDSPWFFEDIHEHFRKDRIDRKDIKVGRVYRWTGTYRMFKNGKCRFSGKVKRVA